MMLTRDNKRGILGAIIVHLILLVILVFKGFFTPLPLPAEEGIMVDFGEPRNQIAKIKTPPKPKPQAATSKPKPKPTKKIEKPKTIKPSESKQEVLTQNVEKTAYIDNEAKKKKQREEVAKAKRLKDAKEKARIERERKAAEEAQRLKEIERQKQQKAEEERLRKEAEQKRIAAINNRAKNVFAKNTNTNQTPKAVFPDKVSTSPQGNGKAENKGVSVGNGISFSLDGRSLVGAPPKPNYPGDEEGIVVVRVKVDRNGRVLSATPGEKGSTTINSALLQAAKRAALKTRFNVANDAPYEDVGTITYRFVLD